MPEQPGPTLAYIPELLELIGHRLAVPQLACCARTCKLWHQILTPLLWETFDDSRYQWPRILPGLYYESASNRDRLDKAWLDGLFAKYGRYIRTLRVQWCATVFAATSYGVCTQLESLQTLDFNRTTTFRRTRGWSDADADADAAAVLPILEDAIGMPSWALKSELFREMDVKAVRRLWTLIYDNSSTLRFLRLDQSLGGLCSFRTFDPQHHILFGLQNLKEMDNSQCPMNLDLVLQRLPHLRSIRGKFINNTSTTPYSNLRSLNSIFALDPPTVRMYLQKFPNLNSLSMDQLAEVPRATTTTPLHQVQENNIVYQLKEFRFTNPQGLLVRESAKRVITWLPYLTHITLNTLFLETAEHLAEHCKHLESFRQVGDWKVNDGSYMTNTVIKLLAACPKLKILDTIQHQVTAHALLTGPLWVCHGLETFRCQIVGIPQLTESSCQTLRILASSKSSSNVFLTPQARHALRMSRGTMEQQQRILERFARLTRLKVLELSLKVPCYLSRYEYVDYRIDTLALTLDSGLGQLAALSDLEMFGFEGCYHAIGLPELQWMIQNWPRLKAMRGLQKNGLPDSPFEVRKAWLRDYMKRQRPDIQQQGEK